LGQSTVLGSISVLMDLLAAERISGAIYVSMIALTTKPRAAGHFPPWNLSSSIGELVSSPIDCTSSVQAVNQRVLCCD
jgi:hypothetical protein